MCTLLNYIPKFRKTLHRGWTALRIIKFRKRRFSGVKLWPGATCGPEMSSFPAATYRAALLVAGKMSKIYTRILVAKCPKFIPGFW